MNPIQLYQGVAAVVGRCFSRTDRGNSDCLTRSVLASNARLKGAFKDFSDPGRRCSNSSPDMKRMSVIYKYVAFSPLNPRTDKLVNSLERSARSILTATAGSHDCGVTTYSDLGHPASTGSLFTEESGKATLNLAPRFELFLAQSRPPCASTMERDTAKPIPIPFAFVVTNALKIFSLSRTPGPLSITCTSISFCLVTAARTLTSGGVDYPQLLRWRSKSG
jgi:hypothetical protein